MKQLSKLILIFVLNFIFSVKGFYLSNHLLAFSDCGSEFILDYVQIENCTSSPCRIVYNRNYNIVIHLTSTQDSASFTQNVYVKLFGYVFEPVVVTPEEPCSALPCPLGKEINEDFRAIINVSGGTIPIPTASELTWVIKDETGDTVICMRTPVYLSLF